MDEKARIAEYYRNYNKDPKNIEKRKASQKKYDEKNKVIINEKRKEKNLIMTDEDKEKLKEYNRNYNVENREKKREIEARSKEKNKVKISETRKIAYQNMDTEKKETLLERLKEYREENKDEIREKRRVWAKEKYTCECGKECRNDYKNDHLKTKAHLKIMEMKNN